MARQQLPNPPPSSAAVRAVMQANRAKDTVPELTLRRALRQAGHPGYRLNWRGAPGRPDISYPGRRVAVFVHGCYWHHCPRCHPHLPKSNREFWARKFELNRDRDARKRAQLEASGWRVHEIWECDIRDRLDGMVVEIFHDPSAVRHSSAGSAATAGGWPLDGPESGGYSATYWWNIHQMRARTTHYRSHDGVEVDVVLEDRGGRLVGIEVKASSTVRASDVRGLRRVADRATDRWVRGVVFYLGRDVVPFGERLHALPLTALWETHAQSPG